MFCPYPSGLPLECTQKRLPVSGRRPVGSGCVRQACLHTIRGADRQWVQSLPHLWPAPLWSHCRVLRFSGKKTLPAFQVSDFFVSMAIWNQLSPNQPCKNHLVLTVRISQRVGAVIPGKWSSTRPALCSLSLGNDKAQKSLRTWLGTGVG